ncbi:MAG: hypothetical protein H7Y11_09780, partial [Armatimonadetes bacterium]|nr:hypothetical protein [Anaerolineae bacterium]
LLDDSVAKYASPQILGAREGLGKLTELIVAITTGERDVMEAAAEFEAAANEELAKGQEALQ